MRPFRSVHKWMIAIWISLLLVWGLLGCRGNRVIIEFGEPSPTPVPSSTPTPSF